MGKNYYSKNGNASNKNAKVQKAPRLTNEPFTIREDDKKIYGAYFNMALDNFFKTIAYIFNVLDIKQFVRTKYNGEYVEVPMFSEESLHIILKYYSKFFGGTLKSDKLKKNVKKLSRLSSKDEEQEQKYEEDLDELIQSLQLTNEQQQKFQQMLFRHFPFLGPIMADYASYSIYQQASKDVSDKEDIKKRKKEIMNSYDSLRGVTLSQCLEELSKMADCLTDCRNKYTHFKPYNSLETQKTQLELQFMIAKKLDKLLAASRRLTKQNIAITTEEMEFITGIDHYENVNKQFIEREDFYFNPKGKGMAVIESTDANGAHQQSSSTYDAFSPFGIAYFCILFLSKTYARLFIDEINLFAGSPFNDSENAIMREIMSLYRVRTPRGKRLDSKATDSTLGMDMLNELRKCPMELYETLSQEGRRFFEDEVKRQNDHTPEVVKRLRSTDRFPYLAMRYIDETQMFDDIRFQVRLGSYRFRFYKKIDCVDGVDRVRRIQKEINGFGRLQDIENERKTNWEAQMQDANYKSVKLEHEDLYLDLRQFPKDTESQQPYITDRRAEYNIHNNRIGLYWNRETDTPEYLDDAKCFLPKLETTGDAGKRKAQIIQPAPLCTLSVRELPAMLFYQWLCDNYKTDMPHDSAELLIKKKYDSLVRLFTAIKNGTFSYKTTEEATVKYLKNKFKLTLADVPQKLRMYIVGKETHPLQRLIEVTFDGYEDNSGKHKGKLEQRREKIERRLEKYKDDRKKIGDKTNTYGKKSFVDVRLGSLAKFLARDIIEWQPSNNEGRDKMTGMNYTVMQSFLASYGTKQAEQEGKTRISITQMFTNAKLLNGPTAHPFLQNVLNKGAKNIEKFYLDYLQEEIDHIKSLEDRVKNGEAKEIVIRDIPFIHPDRVKYTDRSTDEAIRKQAARYMEIEDKDADGNTVIHRTTIMLPDGMFITYINDILRSTAKSKEFRRFISPSPSYASDADRKKKSDELKNTAYTISRFFEYELGDKSQLFYYANDTLNGDKQEMFARNYKLFQTLRGIKSGPGKLPYYLSPSQILTGVKNIQSEIDTYIKDNRQSRKYKIEHPKFGKQKMFGERLTAYLNEEDEKERKTINILLSECKHNEKTIRRYKTQDMVLFLMAKDLLGKYIKDEDTQEENSLFMLHNVCDDKFLRRTVRYEFPIQVNEERTVRVVQPNMSLKNYGEFYRLLSDERFLNVVERFKDIDVYNYNKLMAELNSYDSKRSSIFGIVHYLEEIIYGTNDILRDEHENEAGFHVEDNPGKAARRNNFRSMLYIYDKEAEKEKRNAIFELLISIRNAFGHNHLRIPFQEWMTDEERNAFKTWISKDDEVREKGHERIAPPTIAERILAYAEKTAEETGIIKNI